MNTIAAVLTLIGRMLLATDAGTRTYAVSLLGPRTRGSKTSKGLEALPLDLPLEPTVPKYGAHPKCRYFRFPLPLEHGGTLGAIPYRVAATLSAAVKLRLGPHGPEFYLDVPAADAHAERVSHATLVLGPDAELGECIWTWFPGDALDTLSDRTVRDAAGNLAFSFGSEGEKIAALTPEIEALCWRHVETHPDVAVKASRD